jgi:hypothetical protein
MPVIAQGELLAGIELMPAGGRKQSLEVWYRESVLTNVEILPVTSEVARQYARIFAELRKAGTPIETNDIWIAAIASSRWLIRISPCQDQSCPAARAKTSVTSILTNMGSPNKQAFLNDTLPIDGRLGEPEPWIPIAKGSIANRRRASETCPRGLREAL